MLTIYKYNYAELEKEYRPDAEQDAYVLFMLEEGGCTLQIHENRYSAELSDLILLKPGVNIRLYPEDGKKCRLFRMVIPVDCLRKLSDEHLDFEESFSFVPYEAALVHSEIETVMVLRNIRNKMLSLDQETYRFGLSYYEKSLLSSFLVLLLRACIQQDRYHKVRNKKELIIDDVFVYIRRNLTEDLSLKKMEEVFFVSREHLCRKFKEATGVSIHRYILNARIDLSKRYLLQGIPVREVYRICGFGTYPHFFKAFKAQCGVTPGEYRKQYKEDKAK